jgi:hypothetical protein
MVRAVFHNRLSQKKASGAGRPGPAKLARQIIQNSNQRGIENLFPLSFSSDDVIMSEE